MYRHTGTSTVTVKLVTTAAMNENHLCLTNAIVQSDGGLLTTSGIVVDTSVTPNVTTYLVDGIEVDLHTINVWNAVYKALESQSVKES